MQVAYPFADLIGRGVLGLHAVIDPLSLLGKFLLQAYLIRLITHHRSPSQTAIEHLCDVRVIQTWVTHRHQRQTFGTWEP